MRPYRIYMKKGEYKLKKQIFRNLCRFLVFILMLAPVDNINNKMNQEEKNYLKKKIRVILIIELFLYAIFIVLSKMDYGLIVVLCIAIVAGLLILGNISNRIQERGEKYDIQDRDM